MNAKQLGPARGFDWISDTLGELSRCVLEHKGVLVDYVGDELLAMWGAPAPQGDHASLACRAALDMIERLPTPFGLVRSGVAPDHPKLKESILVYDRIAHAPGFNFWGNVSVGRDVSVAELRSTHHAVVFDLRSRDRPPHGHPWRGPAGQLHRD